jgi:hypothetical protein
MPLRSELFKDDARLQSCLVSDAAHVTQGNVGDHVSRIQIALLRLGWGDFDEKELSSRTYGTSTAEQVLDFKRSFDIINRKYEQTADDIVGKMTIAKLDEFIDMVDSSVEQPVPLVPHPLSPPDRRKIQKADRPPPKFLMPGSAGLAGARKLASVTTAAPAVSFSGLSYTLVDAIKRSNAAKTPGSLHLIPFLGAHEGPLPEADLPARLDAQPGPKDILVAMWRRMAPFGIDLKIKVILDTWQGIGAKGFKCEPFDHDDTFRFMSQLTAANLVGDAKFCRDAWNVHGPRDSFREMRSLWGEGLHICITQPAARSNTPCDFHIDELQQGGVCIGGWCAPVTGIHQTIGHLVTVGPWLIDEARKKTIEERQKILEVLKKQSGPLMPGVLPPVVKPLLAP